MAAVTAPPNKTKNQRPVLRELKCPNCGSPISQFTPDAQTLVCPKCHSAISETMEGLIHSPGSRVPNASIPIKIGQKVTFDNVTYFVLGHVLYQGWDPEDTSDRWSWHEWQMGSNDGRLLWLSLDEHGLVLFSKVRSKTAFDPFTAMFIQLAEGVTINVSERYPARIMAVDGELSWRAKRGDQLFMVEGRSKEKFYSIQANNQEIEIHEGQRLTKEAVVAALGKEAGEEIAKLQGGGVMQVIGILCIVVAILGFVIAFASTQTGEAFRTETLDLYRGQESSFPITFYEQRPILISVRTQNLLVENTFADVDVSVVSPDDTETYVILQEFWHETGYDEGEFWREQQTSGQDAFVPFQTGQHMINVEMDPESQVEFLTVQVELRSRHISPTWTFWYSVIIGVIGLGLFYFSLTRK